MRERTVRLHNSDEVSIFVKAAMQCTFEVDICYNHVIVDGKSILGVLGMDLNQELTVRYEGDDPAFEAVLDRFDVVQEAAV